jgi:hypothetical protein
MRRNTSPYESKCDNKLNILPTNIPAPSVSLILIPVPSRIHHEASWRGGTGDRLEKTTQNLFPGRVQKMVPLRFAREPGVPVGHTSPLKP